MTMNSRCIAVPLREGENIRRVLLEQGILRKDLAISKDTENIFLPVEEDGEEVLGYAVQERDFQVLESSTKSYREVVEIPGELRNHLPTSFDVIGRVAIIKIPVELHGYAKNIGEAIIAANKSVDTVAVDSGVEGEERLRQLTVVAGKGALYTVHREYGIELEVNPAGVYFSPRLATEHWRVAQRVKVHEVVIDMFCGVGPFSILIAKHSGPEKIYAIDINEAAIDFTRKNIERNKVGSITAICGDSRELVPELEPADRIIMNLPHSAYDYMSTALTNIKPGGVIHYYEVIGHDRIKGRLDDIRSISREQGVDVELEEETEVHTYSFDSSLYCLDLRIRKGD